MPEQLVLCGDLAAKAEKPVLGLNLSGRYRNVDLRLEHVAARLFDRVPRRLIDLMEIAAYVYCADQAISRGGLVQRNMGEPWRREFRFVVPVREPTFWSGKEISEALVEALAFVSDDIYSFEFREIAGPPMVQEYLHLDDQAFGFEPDDVVLFSGGLDSLAGLLERLCDHHRNVCIVSHRSASKIFGFQRRLVDDLKSRFPNRIAHIPVFVTRHGGGTRVADRSHRTRTFLYAAIGCVIARMLDRNDVYFFENGVVSINLPIAEQLVGTRSTRSTHPQTLALFGRFFSAALGASVTFPNPFVWRTKGEVVDVIMRHGCADLIGATVSCSNVHKMALEKTHCGCCSQCIDRRFGVLAAGAAEHDPPDQYRVDLLTGPREEGRDRTMAEAYVRTALEMQSMSELDFFRRYGGESARVLSCFPSQTPDEVGQKVIDLHRRHAEAVRNVLVAAASRHSADLVEQRLPATSVLVMTVSRGAPGTWDEFLAQTDPVPEVTDEPLASEPTDKDLRVSEDPDNNAVTVLDVTEFTSAESSLLRPLIAIFRMDREAEREPGDFRYMQSPALCDELGLEDPASLRRRVNRCRNHFREAYEVVHGSPPADDLLIQSQSHKGYRLNPRIRLVAHRGTAGMSRTQSADVTKTNRRARNR